MDSKDDVLADAVAQLVPALTEFVARVSDGDGAVESGHYNLRLTLEGGRKAHVELNIRPGED